MANILEIDATANTAELKAGLEQAKTSTTDATAKMSADFRKLADDSQKATTQISNGYVKVAQTSATLKQANKEVSQSLRAVSQAAGAELSVATIKAAAALQNQARAAAANATALKAIKDAQEGASESAGHMTGGVIAASSAIRTFEGHLPIRAVERFLVETLKMGPALRAAFPVIGAIALANVVLDMLGKISDLVLSFDGLTDHLRETYRAAVAGSQEAVIAQLKLHESLASIGTTGLSGVAKTSAEMRVLATNSKDAGKVLGDLLRQQQALEAEIQGQEAGPGGISTETIGRLTGAKHALEDTKESYKNITKEVQELTKQLQFQAPEQRARLQAQAGAEAFADQQTLSRSQIEARRRTDDALLAGQEQFTKESRSLQQISAEEEARQLRDEATQRFEILQRDLAARRSLALAEQLRTGKPAGPALAEIAAEEITAESEKYRQISAIDTALALEQRRHSIEVSAAQIEAARSAADVTVRLAEQSAREEYQSKRTTAEENMSVLKGAAAAETDALVAAEGQRYEAEKKARAAELALAQQEPEKQAAQIIRLNQESENAEKEHQARLAQIRREGSRLSQEDQKRIEQDAQRRASEQLAYTEQISNRELQSRLRLDDQRLKEGAITRGAWLRDETAAVEQWYAKQHEALERSLAMAKATYGEQSVEYKRMQDKIAELDQQRELKERELNEQALAGWRNWSNQVTHTLSSGVNQWIEGQKTFGQAMAQTWNNILMDTIQDIEKIGEQWIAEHVLMKLATELLGLDNSKQQQVASNNTANVAMATSDAAVAAGGTFAWWSAVYPPVAPAMAAAAYAEGLAFAGLAAFEQGGVVPSTGLAMVHGGEMVLPSALSQKVQSMATQNVGNAYGDVHVHYNPSISGAGSKNMKSLLSDHADHIGRIVKQQMRTFNR